MLEQLIKEQLHDFVVESPDNRFPESDAPYFDPPLIGFAAADDPLFSHFKTIIGDFHLTPAEIMRHCYGPILGEARTVICWILPITRATREANRRETRFPALPWALTRDHGEQFNTLVRMFVVDLLRSMGMPAVAPLLSGMWSPVRGPASGLASTWSERHAAYAAGLGTFSLNDGLITEKGIAHRCGSVITDAPIQPSPRPYENPWSNCTFCRDGGCGLCIERCPVGAITSRGARQGQMPRLRVRRTACNHRRNLRHHGNRLRPVPDESSLRGAHPQALTAFRKPAH